MITQIPSALQPLLESLKAEQPTLLKLLKVGQILPARVLSTPTPNTAKLLMLGNQVSAETNVQLKPGQHLQLHVVKTGDTPQLQIQQAVSQKTVTEQFVVLKDALPKQQLPKEVQTVLRAIVTSPIKTEASNAKLFTQIIENKAVPVQRLTAPAVKQSLNQSGIFLEANMARGVVPTTDTKAEMLRLLTLWVPGLKEKLVLKQKPDGRVGNSEIQAGTQQPRLQAMSLLERLTRLLEGSIARVQTHQATSLPSEDGNRQVWQFEIPIKLPDTVEQPLIQIEREERHKDGEMQKNWSVNLSFDFDTLGPVQSRILLEGEAVSATFWSENEATTRLIQQKLPLLEAALRHAGLEVGHVVSARGRPQDDFMRVDLEHALLDERA